MGEITGGRSECELDVYRDEDIDQMHNRALDMVRGAVDLVSFRKGWGLIVYLNLFVDPDGKEILLFPAGHHIAEICTAYSEDNINEVFHLASLEPAIFETLNDLILAIATPHHAPVNCGRAIEGIRHLINPDRNKKAAWNSMAQALNATQDFTQYIYDLSISPRHGNRSWISTPEQEESIRRSWLLMNRFFEYLKRGRKDLPHNEFTLLIG